MFKLHQVIYLAPLAATLAFLNGQKVNAVTFNFKHEGFSSGAIETGFFTGEDTNKDGILSFSEITNFLISFEGNSEIPAFNFTPSNLVLSEPNFVSYNYGASFNNTDDDIAFSYMMFFAEPTNNLFIRKTGTNDYTSDSGTTTFAQFSSNNFSTIPISSTSTTQAVQVQAQSVPEPFAILGTVAGLGFGVLLKRKKDDRMIAKQIGVSDTPRSLN
jgi:hypothetical protein